MYTIEHVELKKPENGAPNKYPFPQMEIGESFLADRKAFNAACGYGRYHGKKFSSRKEGDAVRIFRVG